MRAERITGVLLVLTALGTVLGNVGDPYVESHDDRTKFVEQVTDAADRIPLIYVFQAADVVRVFLAVGAGVGLYLLLRQRARGVGLTGLVMLVLSGLFAAATAIVGAAMVTAADDYVDEGLGGIGTGSDELLEVIRVLTILHFGNFLAGFAALGLAVGAFSYGLAWSTAIVPRWLGWLGAVSSGLLCLTPLALTHELLFIPPFVGALLALIWLVVTGVRFAVATASDSAAA